MLMLSTQSCYYRIDSDNVGIQVDNWGSDKGKPFAIPVSGGGFYNPVTTDIHEWPANLQTKNYGIVKTETGNEDNRLKVTSADQGDFHLDLTYVYRVERSRAGGIFQKYRKDLGEIEETSLKTTIRKIAVDLAIKYSADSLLKKRDMFEKLIYADVREFFSKEGFALEQLVINDLGAPEAYKQRIQNKLQLEQEKQAAEVNYFKRQVELKTELYENEVANKVKVANASSEAQVIALKQSKLTPEYLEYLKVQNQSALISKWSGNVPTTVMGSGTSSPLIYNLAK